MHEGARHYGIYTWFHERLHVLKYTFFEVHVYMKRMDSPVTASQQVSYKAWAMPIYMLLLIQRTRPTLFWEDCKLFLYRLYF